MSAPIFILAGEPSGDALAARMMMAIETKYGKQNWIGVGGDKMLAQGLKPLADMDQLSIVGFSAVLTAYSKLSALANDLVAQIVAHNPKLVMTVDAKGFSIRLAARLKRRLTRSNMHIPIVHAVAPTIWAWGAWRRHKFARHLDGLLCLFPHEPAFFDGLDVKASFIGHPEAWASEPASQIPATAAQQSDMGTKKLCLLPGSRRSEVGLLLPRMLAALDILREQGVALDVTLPTVSNVQEQVEHICAGHGIAQDITINTGREAFLTAMNTADVMMAASGTVTLQTALHAVPGVVCYATSPLSAFIGRRLVNMDNVVLPNALLGRPVYPFLFQEQATPQALAVTVQTILADAQALSKATGNARALTDMLRGGGNSFDDMVAQAMTPWLETSPKDNLSEKA
ncbi:lipid-A-disaccharide synthase [Candidatus Puniceispirillum marinum]|uniref:Lipid-A-disaccharide synthase n=1 Tax=Puniceispirillum marinum (strain IMCC1322) TaxID=488538 RepID=D5BR34_PUNMI|nr:lipid-A-disaccharide synthase [Candidatus Puniceispirillum marinum]ADE38748.1 Lipid A disaccharide synthetase [Candidatus Puniceispirillum marinum IMCC1322]